VEWLAGICGVALFAWWWRAEHKTRPLAGGELQRLRRAAEDMRRDQFQPFD